MIIKDWKKDLFTIPNMLSVFRLILIPVYIAIYLHEDYYIAGSILAVSCLTDLIDGQIARRFNMISTVGKFLDPLADKATQISLTVCLAIKHPILWILAGLLAVKESFQFIAGLITFRKGKMLAGALITGKICTTILFISLIILVMMPGLSEKAVSILTAVDCVALIISFIGYARIYFTHSPMIQQLDPSKDQDA